MSIILLTGKMSKIICLCSIVHMAKSLKPQTCLLCLIRQIHNWNYIEHFG